MRYRGASEVRTDVRYSIHMAREGQTRVFPHLRRVPRPNQNGPSADPGSPQQYPSPHQAPDNKGPVTCSPILSGINWKWPYSLECPFFSLFKRGS